MSTGLPTPPRAEPASDTATANGAPASRRGARASRRGRRAPQRWIASPEISRREIGLVVLCGVLLAVLTTWPLVVHLPSRIAPDLGDPIRTSWEIAFVGHALLHNPLHLFDANAFYPHPLSLAFSDSLLGYGPAAFFGSGTVAALVRYNLLFLFAWSLCFVGAYLLARELGLRKLAAGAAGVAFAYAPYRVTEAGHLHVISSGGLALALFLLVRGYRRTSARLVLAGWLVSAWQISLGFTLGLQYVYLCAVLALLVLVYWWRGRLDPGPRWRGERGEDPRRRTVDGAARSEATPGEADTRAPVLAGDLAPGAGVAPLRAGDGASGRGGGQRARGPLIARKVLIVTVLGIALTGVVSIYQAAPYLKVANDYPTAKRTLKEVRNYSSGPAALLSASSENRVWGGVTSGMRAKVHSQNEDVFFPGGLILLLALIGLAGVGGSVYTRNLRLGLALGALSCSILAMGLGLTGAGYPYRLLFDHAPGWNGVRVPGRVFTLGTLFYALLAGAGAQLLIGLADAWGKRRSLSSVPALVGVTLLVGLLGEGAGHLAHPVVPQPAKAEIGLAGPLLDLPTDGPADRLWQYFSTNGFYKIPVGNSTFDIPAVDDLRGGMSGFPDRASIEKLRYYGVRTVVLHLSMPKLPGIHGYAVAEPANLPAAAAKSVAGLGVTRRSAGSLVIYSIGAGPKSLHGRGP